MIGIDTNILIRYFVQDEPEQARSASRLIRSLTQDELGWISITVLMELNWILEKIYKMKRADVIRILDHLIQTDTFEIESQHEVEAAIALYRAKNIGFADCMISVSAQSVGCSQTFTFDKKAARDAGMTLLG
jgi:predicted nucleic-acid-binding protein